MNTGTVNDESPRSSHPNVTQAANNTRSKLVARVLRMIKLCVMGPCFVLVSGGEERSSHQAGRAKVTLVLRNL